MDQQQDSFKLISKSNEYALPFQFKKMQEVKKSIFKTLVQSPNHQYDVQSDVSEENLKSFIDYLVDGIAPNINIHNFSEFSLLSQEFDVTIYKDTFKCFPYGILKSISIQTNGNISNEFIVSSSKNYSEDRKPEKGISFDDLSPSFASANELNSWFCIEFINHEICVKYYFLRSYLGGANTGHPKNWILEGSNDKNNWETIDEQKDCPFLNGKSFSHIFQVNNYQNKYFKYIRIRLTGITWRSDYYLIFNCIDLYGDLI